MKIYQSIFSLIIIISMFSTFALPQEKSKLPPLSENASLKETQKWLIKTIRKFSKHSSGGSSENQYTNVHKNEHNSISEVKFEGCKLTYFLTNKSATESHFLHSPVGSVESLPSAGTSGGRPTVFEESTVVSLDLSQLNSRSISYTDLTPKGMTTFFINTLTGEKSVLYIKSYRKLTEKEVFQNRAIFIVRDEAAEQIITGLTQAIKICQQTK